jgi:hypothetical protein
VQRVYIDVSWMGQTEDEDGKEYWDADLSRMDWDDHIKNLQAALSKRYKSVRACDEWLDREDHAISKNRHAYFGVSSYCGLLCVWVVPKDEGRFYTHDPEPAFAQRWVESIGKSFESIVADVFGNTLRKLGTFSNGESIYEECA